MSDDLGLMSEGSSEYLRFKPSANAWIADGDELELKDMLLDPSALQVGWGRIKEGEAPDWKWDESTGYLSFQRITRPTDEHRRGFSISVKVPELGWREWSANGVGVLEGFTELWQQVGTDARKPENKGKAIHVRYKGSQAKKVGQGNTRVPKFEVVAWRDMDEKAAPVKEAPKAHPDLDDDIPF